MVSKIALGTVQFGLDYGINNATGKVEQSVVSGILEMARQQGIQIIDTAYAYGDSELALGNTNLTSHFKIISKFPSNSKQKVSDLFMESLQQLRCTSLYGYLLHNFSIYHADKSIWQELIQLKKRGLVKKIGISLYSVEELETLWEDNVKVDIVQIPYNIFDRRFEKIMPELKNRGIEIHTRSTFLQGLFFKSPTDLHPYFFSIKDRLIALHEFSRNENISIAELCLRFVLKNKYLDNIVIGIDHETQLKHNLAVIKKIDQKSKMTLPEVQVNNLEIINPSQWKV